MFTPASRLSRIPSVTLAPAPSLNVLSLSSTNSKEKNGSNSTCFLGTVSALGTTTLEFEIPPTAKALFSQKIVKNKAMITIEIAEFTFITDFGYKMCVYLMDLLSINIVPNL